MLYVKRVGGQEGVCDKDKMKEGGIGGRVKYHIHTCIYIMYIITYNF